MQMDEKYPWIHATACKVTPSDISDQNDAPTKILSVCHTESRADGKTAASKLFLQLRMVQLPSHSSPPFVTSLDKVREIMLISRAQTRSYLKERRKPHKALSSKGQFACNLVEPYLNWFGKNNRILLTQCLGRVKVEEWNGTSSTIVNGSSHNYAGFYKATDESEELQRLCLEKLPFADPKATPLLQAATHTALSRFFGADFCYTCSTGYGANYIALPALVDSTYLVLLDEEVHNSMLTGTYLAQARCVKKFAHNDMEQLETILAELGDSFDNVLIAVEGFYSMDGSIPRLDQLYRLKKQYNFTLYCDEAHSFLSIGQTGRGCLEFWNEGHPDAPLPSDMIDIRTATLSKAIGGIGGLVCGKAKFENAVRERMEQLHAQGEEPLSCSTMVQTLWVLGQPTRAARHIQRLRDMARFCRNELARFGIYVYGDATIPVLPVHTGRPSLAAKLSYTLRQHGLLATAISYPAVAFWQSRVRITLSADHSDSEIDKLLDAVINAAQIVGLIKKPSLKRRPYTYDSPSIDQSTIECSEASQTYNKILTLIHSSATNSHSPEHTWSVSVTQSGHRSRSVYGLGSGGSRWISGAFPPHLAVESLVARLTGMEAALTYADSSIGLASTIASLCRPLIGYTSHYLLIPVDAPGPVEDGLLIAPRKAAPIVFKYTDLPDLFRLSRELSNKNKSKTYLTIYLNTNHNNTLLDMPSTLYQLSNHKPHTTGLTLLLHCPNSRIASIPPTFNLNQKLPNTQLLITGSFYHMFGLAGAYLAGSTTLIGELRYTSRGYMFTTSPQPFAMSMVQTLLEERLAGECTP